MNFPPDNYQFYFDPHLFLEMEKLGQMGMYETDMLTGVFRASPNFISIFGLPPREEYSMATFQNLVHPEDAPEVMRFFTECIEKKQPFNCEYRCLVHDKVIYVRSRSKLIYNDAGKLIKLLGVKQNISDVRKAEASILKNQKIAAERLDELEAIYDSAPVGLCVLDLDLRYIRINEKLAEINGFSVAHHIGKTVREIVPEMADDIEPVLYGIIRNDQPVVGQEVTGRTPAMPGVERTWLVNWFPFKNRKGKVIGINIVAQEITEQKQREAELHNYQKELALVNEELASTIEELQASNEELVDTINELRMVNDDLDNFVYTASHDLKTPIANIHGLLRVLKKLPEEGLASREKQQQILEMMENSVARFMKTIIDLTDIARLQKKDELETEWVNLESLIQEVQEDLVFLVEQSEAAFTTDLKGCGEIRFTYKNLRSIMYNLISNAIKYRHPERKPLIHIQCGRKGAFWVISVKDNGLGIDLKQQDRMFSMFQRLHDHVEGSGVGLYIVKKIIENAGGRIEVKSEVGKGTTFHVYLKKNNKK